MIPLLTSSFKPKLTISETSGLRFSVWLTDIDASIMNHAAMMTVFEAGRIDYMIRTGFFRLARKQKWYVPISSMSVQFFRPLKVFQKAVVTTKVFYMTEHFIFIEQKITRHGKDIALCIVKSKVKSGKENVATRKIVELLNAKNVTDGPGDLIELYERLDDASKNEFFRE